ncbi:hypothetical protein RND71_001488 [Anisodus tanguticus]|uniref:Uncharacterized protein n=1 Tax=Anisodus tanguticus TaxID=243964 RepID=A0AAE1T2V2_9SOLA|nr:hypothetical protein RND71_001488 [Anisodus tanguticus]
MRPPNPNVVEESPAECQKSICDSCSTRHAWTTPAARTAPAPPYGRAFKAPNSDELYSLSVPELNDNMKEKNATLSLSRSLTNLIISGIMLKFPKTEFSSDSLQKIPKENQWEDRTRVQMRHVKTARSDDGDDRCVATTAVFSIWDQFSGQRRRERRRWTIAKPYQLALDLQYHMSSNLMTVSVGVWRQLLLFRFGISFSSDGGERDDGGQ